MNRRIISALLVFLLLTSVTIPTVTAEPVPIAGAAAPAEEPDYDVEGIVPHN